MSWINTFDGVFFISLATILVGVFGMSIKYCLKSKCEHLSLCCGLINIDRRVDLEVQEEIRALELGVKEDEEKTKTQLPLEEEKEYNKV
jgi:hypothetical protein